MLLMLNMSEHTQGLQTSGFEGIFKLLHKLIILLMIRKKHRNSDTVCMQIWFYEVTS